MFATMMRIAKINPIFRSTVLLFGVGMIFFIVQNTLIKLGGDVAFIKVMWLMSALLFWYFIPFHMMRQRLYSRRVVTVFTWFWINMVARAVIELYMMYVSVNWHPHYGIAHDFLSFAFLGWAWVYLGHAKEPRHSRVPRQLVAFCAVMFLIEAYFAYYMLHNVVSAEPVYYVPADSQHNMILLATWFAVTACIAFVVRLIRHWQRDGSCKEKDTAKAGAT